MHVQTSYKPSNVIFVVNISFPRTTYHTIVPSTEELYCSNGTAVEVYVNTSTSNTCMFVLFIHITFAFFSPGIVLFIFRIRFCFDPDRPELVAMVVMSLVQFIRTCQ